MKVREMTELLPDLDPVLGSQAAALRMTGWPTTDDGRPVLRDKRRRRVAKRRRRVARTSRETAKLSRAVLDSLSAHVAVLDESGAILSVNRAWREFAGSNAPAGKRVAEGANYLRVCDEVTGEDAETARAFAAAIRDVLAGRRAEFAREYPCHAPGKQRWFVGRVTRLHGDGPRRVVIAHDDVTERKRMEEALGRSESRLQAMLDHVPAAVFLKDLDGRYLLVNRCFAERFAVTEEGAVGKTDHDFLLAPIADTFRANDLRIVESGRACELEEMAPHAAGPHTYLSIKAPLLDIDGIPYAICGISTDISERKATEEALRLSEERFHLASLATREAIRDWDLKTDAIWWNDGVTTLFGHTIKELGPGINGWVERIHPEDSWRIVGSIHAAIDDGAQIWSDGYRFRRTDGSYAQVIDRGVVRRDERGEPTRMIGSMMDLTPLKQAEAARRENRERLVAALSASGAGTFRWDIRTGAVDWDEPLDRLFGLPPGKTVGSLDQFLALLHPEDRPGVVERCGRCAAEGTGFSMEFRALWPDGSVHWLDGRGKTDSIEAGRPLSMIGACLDITERKRAEAHLAHQASHDALTGLPNRTLLQRQVERCIASSPGGDARFSLLLLDLDRFKEINDTFGHPCGDAVLHQFSPRLLEAVRDSDLVARLGGDEFGILLPGADEERAIGVAGRILGELESPIVVEGHPFDVGVSIGIALYPEHGLDAVTLMKHADVAMYAAKRARSGRAVYSAGQADLSPRRMRLVGELRQAIADGQLRLHYQPMVDLRTMQPVGAEALVRWQHPIDGLLAPGEFIPLAEQTGLIRPLGLRALQESLGQFLAWRREGLDLRVAVNLAPENLQDDQLTETIDRLFAESDAPSRWLTVEVTESAMMADPTRAKAVLARLHRMGVLIAIDDFGTGYSSLAYLKELPVDKVKIDRSFVRDMAHNERDACIVRSVIDLGHNLGLRVVAEGVEDRATLELLASWGCDLAQGYYIGRPMPPGGVPNWLVEWAGRNDRPDVHPNSVGTESRA